MNVAPPSSDPVKRRILYVITLAWWGGAQHYVYDLAIAAQERGDEVLVLSGEGEFMQRLADAGINTITTKHFARGIKILPEIGSFIDLVQTIRLFKPDVVHANSSKAGLFGSAAARIAGVKKIIFTAHGWAFTERRPRLQKVLFWCGHYMAVILADHTICVSQDIYRKALSMPFVKNRLLVIHNGIAPFQLFPRAEARDMLSPKNTFPLWVGSIAELHPNKQLDTLIKAFSEIAHEFPQVFLVILGEGSERGYLESLIQNRGLTSRVRLCGHVKVASQYLQALDIFVLPSRTEALGYVLLEAGLARLPVIGSNVGGIPEIVRTGETGYLFPSGDESALGALLRKYITDQELRNRVGNTLFEFVSENFSIERMIEQTFALY